MKRAHITRASFVSLVKLRIAQNNSTVNDAENYISTLAQEGGILNL
jgi:hypothetical protein